MTTSAEDLIRSIEENHGPLEPADIDEIMLWYRGRELLSVVTSPGWEVVVSTLQAYQDAAVDTLVKLLPGDERVVPAHAAASAIAQTVTHFMQDVNAAIEAARILPAVMQGVQ
jgi:hypothetical protein